MWKEQFEEIVDTKGWEILALDLDRPGSVSVAFMQGSMSLEEAARMNVFPIKSVKRLSDNEVFGVGDEIEWIQNTRQKIKSFKINELNEMEVWVEFGFEPLSQTKKPPPQPTQEVFTWTDFDMAGFAGYFGGRIISKPSITFSEALDEYKEMKRGTNNIKVYSDSNSFQNTNETSKTNTVKGFPNSYVNIPTKKFGDGKAPFQEYEKPQPNKERIECLVIEKTDKYSWGSCAYRVIVGAEIPPEKLPLIKSAIEKALNNE